MSESTPSGDPTYESATARLDQIIQRLDSGEAQLRETLELCEEAKTLIEYCAGELAAVDQGLKELRLEELAGSLAGQGSNDQVASAPTSGDEPPPSESDVPF